jgi:dihydroorotase
MPLGTLELGPTTDFHCHFRDGDIMGLIVGTIEQGGCDTVLVMVCTVP